MYEMVELFLYGVWFSWAYDFTQVPCFVVETENPAGIQKLSFGGPAKADNRGKVELGLHHRQVVL
jgi:hypothetical protein